MSGSIKSKSSDNQGVKPATFSLIWALSLSCTSWCWAKWYNATLTVLLEVSIPAIKKTLNWCRISSIVIISGYLSRMVVDWYFVPSSIFTVSHRAFPHSRRNPSNASWYISWNRPAVSWLGDSTSFTIVIDSTFSIGRRNHIGAFDEAVLSITFLKTTIGLVRLRLMIPLKTSSTSAVIVRPSIVSVLPYHDNLYAKSTPKKVLTSTEPVI
jgi:hypothetical protein